jgi:predicted transcriptional regulator
VSLEKHFNELIDTLKRHPIITKAELIRKILLNDEGYIRAIAKTLRGIDYTSSNI